MNGKLAKMLRLQVKGTPLPSKTSYKPYDKVFYSREIDCIGVSNNIRHKGSPCVLGDCERKIYKELKREQSKT